jgi:hypothetical protein
MKFSLKKCFGALVACLSLWPILAFAQSSDLAQNLEACKAGRDICDRSRLTASETMDVALAAHGRNVRTAGIATTPVTVRNSLNRKRLP